MSFSGNYAPLFLNTLAFERAGHVKLRGRLLYQLRTKAVVADVWEGQLQLNIAPGQVRWGKVAFRGRKDRFRWGGRRYGRHAWRCHTTRCVARYRIAQLG